MNRDEPSDFLQQLFKIGTDHHRAGRLSKAALIYQQILALHPLQPDTLHVLGLLTHQMGDSELAMQLLQQSLEQRPGIVRIHVELGNMQIECGLFEAAMTNLSQALRSSPEDVYALNSMGSVLTHLNRLDEAEAIFQQALKLAPRSSELLNNLGNVYRLQARGDDALEAYERAVEPEPTQAAARTNLGNALRDRGKIDLALVSLRRAVELNPNSPTLHSNLVYACCFDPAQTARQIFEEARRWADRFETPLVGTHQSHDNDRDPDRRLKIGYVSPDFREHVIGRNVLPVIQGHDRNQFEVHCFSSLACGDSMTEVFKSAADHWHDCVGMNDAKLATFIRDQHIDILIDLSLHLSGNRLITFAMKPAPVQITWAGYPGTTGLRSIDYRITDPYLDPIEQSHRDQAVIYSEQSVRLPHSFWCYRPIQHDPDVNPLPALQSGVVTFGCLNNPAKMTNGSLALWASVLSHIDRSKLLLLCPEGTPRSEIRDYFQAREIACDRIEFVGYASPADHLLRYHAIDICLDPLPYTGHSTTLDALWMGVPVVTLAGQTCAARGSVTALSNLQLHALIAQDANAYVQIARSLADNLQSLSNLRNNLRDRMKLSPLCDEISFTRDLESIYRRAWHQWINNY